MLLDLAALTLSPLTPNIPQDAAPGSSNQEKNYEGDLGFRV